MATFTTWLALYNSMLDQLASGNFSVQSHTLNTGTTIRTVQYQSLAEIREQLVFVKSMADLEGGNWYVRGRAANVRPR